MKNIILLKDISIVKINKTNGNILNDLYCGFSSEKTKHEITVAKPCALLGFVKTDGTKTPPKPYKRKLRRAAILPDPRNLQNTRFGDDDFVCCLKLLKNK